MSSQRSKRRRIQRTFDDFVKRLDREKDNSLVDSIPPLANNSSEVLDLDLSFDINESDTTEFSEAVEDSEIENSKDEKLSKDLGKWAVRNNITSGAVDELLDIFSCNFPACGLPRCSKTLLKTPINYEITKIEGGEYFHFGLLKQLSFYCSLSSFKPKDSLIQINVGVDGLPISRSSKAQFWPILVCSQYLNNNSPFLVGLYFGKKSKPVSAKDFLGPFVEEYKYLRSSQVQLGNQLFNIRIRSIIADAPARNFIKCTVGFNAYYGCERCVQKGKWLGRVTFPETNSTLRTDADFEAQVDRKYHIDRSPLAGLNIGLVSEVVIDYMHLTCLGVMRKLLNCWKSGTKEHKLGRRDILQISETLINCKNCIPKEFNRKPRGLIELDNWKATELRTFLLYLGPLALKGILPIPKYEHFLMFSVSIRILLSNNHQWYDFAQSLLVRFVELVPKLYSKEFLVYNVHSLIHLSDDAKKFGSIDSISAFPMENYMQTLKKMVRSNSNQLQQVIRRVYEQQNVNISAQPKNRSLLISSSKSDRGFLTDVGEIGIVEEIVGEDIRFRKFLQKADYFHNPCPSSKLGIFKVSYLARHSAIIKKINLRKKCIIIPISSSNAKTIQYYVSPLCGDEDIVI